MHEQQEFTKDVYALVTDRIIELLKVGTIPWQKPWTDAGLPRNIISKRPYRGINIMLLNALGYEQNLFLTWKQIKTISASVKKGEKGQFVVFFKRIELVKEINGEQKTENKYVLRYYKVFNVSQCTNIPEAFFPPQLLTAPDPIWQCEQVVEGMPKCPGIVHKKQQAYYDPLADVINMPKLKSFASSESYYGTLFHELVHSTGHKTRVGRKEVFDNPAYGTKPYSLEELVAEMGACYLKSHVGIPIESFANNAAYINGWLDVFAHDMRFLIRAAARAQEGVEYILNAKPHEEQETSPADETVSAG